MSGDERKDDAPSGLVPDGAVSAIIEARHGDPFAVLGLHDAGGRRVARAFVPGAETLEPHTLDGRRLGALDRLDPAGFFAGILDIDGRQPLRHRATRGPDEWWVDDPYTYGPVLGPMDDHFIAEGTHLRLFDRLGAHPMHHEGSDGVHFAVWAPNARRVSVVGAFNDWDGRRHAMRLRRDTGIWEIFVPGVAAGLPYKYEIVGPDGAVQPLKADPFARASEYRPATASIVAPKLDHDWGDAAHRAHWASLDARRQPISIYEVHPGSWQRADDDGFLSWDELADRLIPYCAEMGFTHIEFLPISEHPYDPSWGYQTTGLYAPTARFGPPEGFARFVDGAHRAGIGVILDWVPAHFPTDAHGLVRFDGTALYEHEDPREGFHKDWNTLIYNLGRREVSGFLIASALEWLERYHVDGLRVDAVASMLYRNYSRAEGEWIPNVYGGAENLESVEFLRHLNGIIRERCPGTIMVAEESTAWPGVSAPPEEGGLGFHYKWNMGWMHDTLHYMEQDPVYRSYNHHAMTFGMVYAYSEKFVLPISHDEVVHGKGSLLNKMTGDEWLKCANLRAYLSFMWTHPGKKLLFMGCEIGQWAEWNHDRTIDWHLLDNPRHRGLQRIVRDLNRLYVAEPGLHSSDTDPGGFEWVVGDDAANSVFAFLRKPVGEGAPLLVVCNMTPVPRHHYRIGVPHGGYWREALNSDAEIYGGSNMGNGGGVDADGVGSHGWDQSLSLTLPPLSTIVLRPA